VNLNTAAEFLEAGADALGVGGELVLADALKSGKHEVITDTARQFVQIVKSTRARLAPAASLI
jgi:2-dehydro-3-deoxyphosphogluconate aldolase/(4S)-4-hydroxy-2-oxoglutarate aldolase